MAFVNETVFYIVDDLAWDYQAAWLDRICPAFVKAVEAYLADVTLQRRNGT